MKHGARGKKQTLKSASTDLGTTDVGEFECHICDAAKSFLHHKNDSYFVLAEFTLQAEVLSSL